MECVFLSNKKSRSFVIWDHTRDVYVRGRYTPYIDDERTHLHIMKRKIAPVTCLQNTTEFRAFMNENMKHLLISSFCGPDAVCMNVVDNCIACKLTRTKKEKIAVTVVCLKDTIHAYIIRFKLTDFVTILSVYQTDMKFVDKILTKQVVDVRYASLCNVCYKIKECQLSSTKYCSRSCEEYQNRKQSHAHCQNCKKSG